MTGEGRLQGLQGGGLERERERASGLVYLKDHPNYNPVN